MKIKINSLVLGNFKGIKSHSLDFTENNHLHLLGANATGKTTIYDAFLWLLFNKDSSGRSDFEIKTLDKAGNTKKDLEHSVAGVLLVDGEEILLKKIYKEKWTRKKGSKVDEFTGNETIYYWNDVPVKKAEYDSKIATIISEDKFRLLSDTKYFNGLDWKVRRKMLFGLIEDNIATWVEASPALTKALKGKSTEELAKQLSASRRKILNDIDQYPTRIDEVNKNINELHDVTALETVIKDLASIDAQLGGVKQMSEEHSKRISKLMQEKDAIMQKVEGIKYQITTDCKKEIRTLELQYEETERTFQQLKRKKTSAEYNIKEAQTTVERLEKKVAGLRDDYVKENEKEFKYDGKCSSCGATLAEDKVEAVRATFNKNKSEALENIVNDANGVKKNLAAYQEQLEKEKIILEAAEKEIVSIEEQLTLVNEKIQKHKQDVDAIIEKQIEDSKEIDALLVEYVEVKEKLSNVGEVTNDNSDLIEQRKALLERKQSIERLVHENEITEKNILRVEELEQERLSTLDELSKIEDLEFQLSAYIKAKVENIEKELKTMFNGVGFKMFDMQVNGGLDDTCVVTRDGVPYSDLNTASKIWVSLNIINTFATHYNLSTPIFIDNRESITEIPEMEQQTISLIVSPNHKKITLCPAKKMQ